MKKCLVIALGCLVSCAARAEVVVDVTVQRAGQPTVTKSYAMGETARFDEDGITAELTATLQEGAICITAKCSRVTEDGQIMCDEIPCLVLPHGEIAIFEPTKDVTVTIAARITDAQTTDCQTMADVATQPAE